jgi:integrase
VPVYEFKGIEIKVYKGKNGRFSAHFVGPHQVHKRLERGTELAAVEGAKKEIREMSDSAIQAALLEESTAADILRGTGVSVIEAARSVASWLAKLKPLGASVSDAIDFFVTSRSGVPIKVKDLVAKLIAEKERDTGVHNARDLRCRLENQFCLKFGDRWLSEIKDDELRDWIYSRPGKKRSRRNHHAAITTLFEYGRENGNLPKGRPTEMKLVKKPKADDAPVNIFSPTELTMLIAAGLALFSRALPALLIQCMGGVRHEELEQTDPEKDRVRWSDVWLDQEEPEIHIRKEVSKIGKERFVPLQPALVAWLRLFRQDGDVPVYSMMSLYKDYKRICGKAGLTWKKNAPRKSYNTYDTALSRSLAVTAEGAGNSPEMIRRYYRKAVSQVGKLAQEWFSISPDKFGELVEAYLAHFKAARQKASSAQAK